MTLRFAAGAVALGMMLSACSGEGNQQQGNAAHVEGGKTGLAALEGADGFSNAAKLLKTAQLDQMLSGNGSYTLFAPSDDAFAALPEAQRKALASEEGRPQLIAVLRQHMASGYLTSQDMAKALEDGKAEIASLGAAPIALRKRGSDVLVGEGDQAARIVGTPVTMGNSIAYRIDRFLPPPPSQ